MNQNWLESAQKGQALLEGRSLREQFTHFDDGVPASHFREHGAAAHGYFELTRSLAEFTTAKVLTQVGAETAVFARISPVARPGGSAVAPRDARGFALKFFTMEGDWDLVGNNLPASFIQDENKLPDLVEALKPGSEHDAFWDFISRTPESMHALLWTLSDRAVSGSLHSTEGHGVHSFSLINAAGKITFVKFHWLPRLDSKSAVHSENAQFASATPVPEEQDVFEAIASGNFPEWDLAVQLFSEEQAAEFPFDHLDATKLIPEGLVPLQVIGKIVLDRQPDALFEAEQVVFSPTHLIPGIRPSNDPLLRYGHSSDLYSFSPAMHFTRGVAYEPSHLDRRSFGETRRGQAGAGSEHVGPASRIRSESQRDHYRQARQVYSSQAASARAQLESTLVSELSQVSREHVRVAMIGHLRQIDQSLAQHVADGVGVVTPPVTWAREELRTVA